jgi:hypothetical protein
MDSEDFIRILEEKGLEMAGMCMFAPVLLAPIANRLLNEAYGDSGDNLSIPMCDIASERKVRYLAANYSSANLSHVKNTIDALENIPGSVMLIAKSGVGSDTAQTIGLFKNGQVEEYAESEHSFQSFAEDYLSVKRCEEEAQIPSIEEIAQKASQVERLQLGTEGEIAAKRELTAIISKLEVLVAREVAPQVYGGIGHNRPPSEMTLPKNITDAVTININIIKTEVQSVSPDAPKVINSASNLQRIGEEVIEFFHKISEHLKSDGSRAIAAAIISGIAWTVWSAMKWISTVLGFPIL